MLTDISTPNETSAALTGSGGIGSLIIWIIVLFIMLFMFMFLYLFLNKIMKGTKRDFNIKILKKFYIDRNFYVSIVKIFNEYYLILFSNSSSEIIKKIDIEELNELIGEEKSFIKTFSSFLNKEKQDND